MPMNIGRGDRSAKDYFPPYVCHCAMCVCSLNHCVITT